MAAIRAAQLGMNVGCIDENDKLGGTCLRVGCIPSKALLESSERFAQARLHLAEHGVVAKGVTLDLPVMLKRKDEVVNSLTSGVDSLLKKNKIARYHGRGSLEGGGVVRIESQAKVENQKSKITAKHIVIATGSVPAPLKGVQLGERITQSTGALSYDKVPEHLVVIGAGYIGLELGCVWSRLGAKVTVLEYLDRILPGMDAEIAREAQKILTKQGLEFRLSCKVMGAKEQKGKCVVEIDGAEAITADRVLLATGRIPNTAKLGLEAAGVKLDEKNRVVVNEQYETSAKGVFAIGDCIAGPMLAHKAEDEGIACVEYIATGYGHVNYDAIPGVVYTDPEIASVGKTEEQLKEAGVEYKRGVFHFVANGRARALGQTAGRVKILADAKTDRVLGVHIIGPRAGELIAEAVAAMEFGASSEDIARTSHAHPTLAECIKEAALAVDKRQIHA